MDKTQLKMKIKEEIINENYYLSLSMIKELTNDIEKHKERINELVKEYLNLLK